MQAETSADDCEHRGPLWRGGYVDCRFGQIHFVSHQPVSTFGQPLIMLNPRSRSCRLMRDALPARALYIVDIPGFGGSTPIPAQTTMHEVGAAIVDFMAAEGIERGHVFGIHTGNKVAAAVARLAPGKVASLSLCGKTHSLIAEKSQRNAAMKAQVDRVRPDVAIVRMEGRFADESSDSIAAFSRLYEANFAFDLADALRDARSPVQVIEIVSNEETVQYGLQGALLAACAPIGRHITLGEIDPAGLDMYVGAARLANAVAAFVAEADRRAAQPCMQS